MVTNPFIKEQPQSRLVQANVSIGIARSRSSSRQQSIDVKFRKLGRSERLLKQTTKGGKIIREIAIIDSGGEVAGIRTEEYTPGSSKVEKFYVSNAAPKELVESEFGNPDYLKKNYGISYQEQPSKSQDSLKPMTSNGARINNLSPTRGLDKASPYTPAIIAKGLRAEAGELNPAAKPESRIEKVTPLLRTYVNLATGFSIAPLQPMGQPQGDIKKSARIVNEAVQMPLKIPGTAKLLVPVPDKAIKTTKEEYSNESFYDYLNELDMAQRNIESERFSVKEAFKGAVIGNVKGIVENPVESYAMITAFSESGELFSRGLSKIRNPATRKALYASGILLTDVGFAASQSLGEQNPNLAASRFTGNLVLSGIFDAGALKGLKELSYEVKETEGFTGKPKLKGKGRIEYTTESTKLGGSDIIGLEPKPKLELKGYELTDKGERIPTMLKFQEDGDIIKTQRFGDIIQKINTKYGAKEARIDIFEWSDGKLKMLESTNREISPIDERQFSFEKILHEFADADLTGEYVIRKNLKNKGMNKENINAIMNKIRIENPGLTKVFGEYSKDTFYSAQDRGGLLKTDVFTKIKSKPSVPAKEIEILTRFEDSITGRAVSSSNKMVSGSDIDISFSRSGRTKEFTKSENVLDDFFKRYETGVIDLGAHESKVIRKVKIEGELGDLTPRRQPQPDFMQKYREKSIELLESKRAEIHTKKQRRTFMEQELESPLSLDIRPIVPESKFSIPELSLKSIPASRLSSIGISKLGLKRESKSFLSSKSINRLNQVQAMRLSSRTSVEQQVRTEMSLATEMKSKIKTEMKLDTKMESKINTEIKLNTKLAERFSSINITDSMLPKNIPLVDLKLGAGRTSGSIKPKKRKYRPTSTVTQFFFDVPKSLIREQKGKSEITGLTLRG